MIKGQMQETPDIIMTKEKSFILISVIDFYISCEIKP